MQTVAETLSAYASTLKYEDLPAEVVHQAKRTIMDSLGCAFGGYSSEPAKIAREMAALVTSTRPATIIGSGQKTSIELAVYANGVMVRYLDFNDGYVVKGSAHPSDNVAVQISAAEVAHAGGRDLIVATVLAYEVICSILDVWDNKLAGLDAVTIGGIASVVGAARLLGLSQRQIVEAINIMLAGNCALYQTRIGHVSMWKGCACANASRNAIFAAQLAARGMTGPAPIFEGRNGFFNTFGGRSFELAPFGGGTQHYRIMRAHLKQFPLGNYGQSVVTAILDVRALVSDIRDIAEVHINTSQRALNVMAEHPEKWRPQNRETADHSIPYTAGVALMYGTIDPSYFDERYFHDEQLLDLISRIKCNASEEATKRVSEALLCEVDVILRSGERKSVRVEHHRGHWRNPMSDAEVETKFRTLVDGMLPSSKVDALTAQLWKLEDLPEVGALVQMTKIDS